MDLSVPPLVARHAEVGFGDAIRHPVGHRRGGSWALVQLRGEGGSERVIPRGVVAGEVRVSVGPPTRVAPRADEHGEVVAVGRHLVPDRRLVSNSRIRAVTARRYC